MLKLNSIVLRLLGETVAVAPGGAESPERIAELLRELKRVCANDAVEQRLHDVKRTMREFPACSRKPTGPLNTERMTLPG